MEIGKRYIGAGKRKRSSPLPPPLQPSIYPVVVQPSYENSLLLHRLPSPSLHWPGDAMTPTYRRSACETVSSHSRPILDSKRSFTSDYLTNAPFLLNEDNSGLGASVARSFSSEIRTGTPVSSSSCPRTLCTAPAEVKQPSSHASVQSCHLSTRHHQSQNPRHARSSSRSTDQRTVANGLAHKSVGRHNSRVPSPCLSTFGYEQYQKAPLARNVSRPDRPLPALPQEAVVAQRSSEVSFMDWDSDDSEDDALFPISRVNAMFKRSLADLRPAAKTKTNSQSPQSDYGTIKFGLSVVLENPSAKPPIHQATRHAPPNSTIKRVVTNPTPHSSRRVLSKSDTGHRSTVVGCENIYQLSDLRGTLPLENRSPPNTARRDSQSDELVHRTKRRRLSKFSHWVKRRVSGSSK